MMKYTKKMEKKVMKCECEHIQQRHPAKYEKNTCKVFSPTSIHSVSLFSNWMWRRELGSVVCLQWARGSKKIKRKKVVKCEFIIIRLNEAKQNIKRNKDKIYNNKYNKILLKQKRLVLKRKILQAFFNNNFKKVCNK